jgi:hypothetical protein
MKDRNVNTGRRAFLAGVSAVAAVSALGPQAVLAGDAPAAGSLPMIRLGNHSVSRLIAGHNTIAGFSYQGHHMDLHMREYFTVERIIDFLTSCEQQGINTIQFSWLDKTVQALRTLRERGSKMQNICLLRDIPQLKVAIDAVQPIGIAHHGGVTDTLFAQGKSEVVLDFIKAVRDHGVLAGVSAHNPDNIRRIADADWPVDFFMTSFYFISRQSVARLEGRTVESSTIDLNYTFLKNDPIDMARVIQQVKQPCLAFKILGAGRLCHGQQQVKDAFKFAYSSIKPKDAVIIGLYPRFSDEIRADAQYAREMAVG